MNKDERTTRAVAANVAAYKHTHGCSIFEAKRAVTADALLRAINDAQTMEDLKAILRGMMEAMHVR